MFQHLLKHQMFDLFNQFKKRSVNSIFLTSHVLHEASFYFRKIQANFKAKIKMTKLPGGIKQTSDSKQPNNMYRA